MSEKRLYKPGDPVWATSIQVAPGKRMAGEVVGYSPPWDDRGYLVDIYEMPSPCSDGLWAVYEYQLGPREDGRLSLYWTPEAVTA